MVENGKGGGNTTTGLRFEEKIDILKFLDKNVPNLHVEGDEIFYNSNLVASSYRKNRLYKDFLEKKGVNYLKFISKKLLPDDAIYIEKYKTLFVIEMKFQKVAGSVDEKLQTCYFKRLEYEKLFKPLGIKIEYLYILNDWFKKPEYKDVLDYIKFVGCDYHFNEIPADFIEKLIK